MFESFFGNMEIDLIPWKTSNNYNLNLQKSQANFIKIPIIFQKKQSNYHGFNKPTVVIMILINLI